jgi:hypothetical protein
LITSCRLKLVESVKSQDGKAARYIDQIAKADEATLLEQLKENAKKAFFFINVYNGFTNTYLRKIQTNIKNRGDFF